MDAEQSMNLSISILYRYRRMYLTKQLEECGTTAGCSFLLSILNENDGASQEQISDILKTDKATVARAVQKLEAAEYIRREEDPSDKRAYRVFLTEKGRGVDPVYRSVIGNWSRIIEQGIPPEELALFKQTLEKLSQNACQTMDNPNFD